MVGEDAVLQNIARKTGMVMRSALLAGLVVVGASVAGPGMAQEAGIRMQERTLTITATGQVSAVPDLVTITTGVLAEAETAKQAVAANTTAMRNVIAALKSAGLEDRDVQTAEFSVQPKYVYAQDGSNTPPKLVGYQVSNQVLIRVRDLKRVGDVLDQVVTAGSNQIAGINFTVSNADTLLDKAREAAVLAARRKAEIYAKVAGVKLGPIVSISEGGQGNVPQPMRQMAMADKASAVPVEAGETTLSVDVTIVWRLE